MKIDFIIGNGMSTKLIDSLNNSGKPKAFFIF